MLGGMSGGQLVTQCLAREGVQHVFCVPGESYLEVLDGLYDETDIQLISTRHEGGAAFMAEAYAKSSGRVGVCMATRAVGLSNLAIGLHTAKQDSTPVVALVGQVAQAHLDREAFQEVAQTDWFRNVCKWTVEIRQSERIPELIHRAFAVARSGRPGPVLCVLPQDVLDAAVSDGVTEVSPYRVTPPQPDLEALKAIHSELVEAKSPFVIVGGGVLNADAAPLVVELARRYALPVITAFRRFDAIPNSDPCYAGWLGFTPLRTLVEELKQADFVLAIGTRLSQVTTVDYTLPGKQAKVVVVDVDPLAGAAAHPPTQAVTADAGAFCQALLDVSPTGASLSAAARSIREERQHQLHRAYLQFSDSRVSDVPRANSTQQVDGFAMPAQDIGESENRPVVHLEHIIGELGRMPKDTIITSDAGNFFGWLARYYRFEQPGTYVGATSGAMGYGLPAALGVKLAHPDRTVIAVVGDGGFMMTMAEMATAMLYGIHVVVIVINNQMYGTIRAHQERRHRGRQIGTSLHNPSFAEMARTFGGFGIRVTHDEAFLPALEGALQADKVAVIEVMSNPDVLSVDVYQH